MAMEVLKEVSADDQLRTKIRLQEKAENDWKARVYYAKLEGRKEGREEARKEGRKEGVRESKLEIARNALGMLDDEAIAQLTGLTLAEIAALRLEQ